MPTTYKTTRTFYEIGTGIVTDVFVVSDDVAELIQIGSALEVGVFDVESTKHTLDAAKGSVMEAELSLSVNESTIETTDDLAAVAFALAGLNPLTPRFVARFLNPTTPVADAETDAEFIGLIKTTGSASDIRWHGVEYATTPDPDRVWKLKAHPYEIGTLFGMSCEDIFLGVPDEFDVRTGGIAQDTTWIAANVADRLGYAIIPADSSGPYREARYGSLVAFSVLMQKILDIVAPAGTTITWEDTTADFIAVPYCFAPSIKNITGWPFGGVTTHVFRYILPTGSVERYYAILAQEARLTIGGDPATNGSLFVHFKNVVPELADREFSWLQYGTVGELLAALAQNFGAFLDVQYASLTAITVRFKTRSMVGEVAETFLRDVKQAELNIEYTVPDKGAIFTGQATRFNSEGGTAYVWDGFGNYQPPYWQGPKGGRNIPLTISPSLVRGTFAGHDASIDLDRTFGGWWLPTGVAFYNDGPPATKFLHDGKIYDFEHREECNTAMFVRMDGPPDAANVTLNCEGETIWAPIGRIRATLGGKEREYGFDWRRIWDLGVVPTSDPADPKTPGYGMGAYLNDLFGIDEAFFDNTYTLTVPGLQCFRSTIGGADDWRNVQIGSGITLDGVVFRVIDIERRTTETVLKLHAATRFVYTAPSTGTAADPGEVTATIPAPDPSGPSSTYSVGSRTGTVIGLVCGETVEPFQVVAYLSGKVWVGKAHHDHYRCLIGVALEGGVEDDVIQVQVNGCVRTGEAFAFADASKLFLRTGATLADPNISIDPLPNVDADEDLHHEIGLYIDLGGVFGKSIVLDPSGLQFVHQPVLV